MLDKPIMTKIEPIEISDDEDVVDGDDTVEITNTVPGVPKHIPGEVEFVKQQPSHPRVRAKMKQNQKKIKNENAEDNVVFIKQLPSHPRDRMKRINKRQTKEAVKKVVEKIKNNEKYANQIKQMINYQQPKVYLDTDVITELPNFNTAIKVDSTNRRDRDNEIFNKIISQLPPDKDRYYIEHSRKKDTFITRKEKRRARKRKLDETTNPSAVNITARAIKKKYWKQRTSKK